MDKSINVFDEIQTICRDFRRQLKAGVSASIEQYLPLVSESARSNLFQNLLTIDVEFRRRQGETPTSEEYIRRFPSEAKLIRQAFFESTMMSMSPDVDTPENVQTILFGMPAARRLGDFELLREVGRGGFGVVYEARHLKTKERVALKTLPTGSNGDSHPLHDAERLHKFRREFRSLVDVNHPNLVGMQSLEFDGTQWFFTMDLVEGVDFQEYVRPHHQLDEERLRSVLPQLVRGINALHLKNIVHRDLKPSNVMVRPDGRVVVLDFGLVSELQQPNQETLSVKSKGFAGTPRYAAPEQAFGERSPASDWYAFGTMLFEALTGEAPYRGSSLELVMKKQNEDAPQLSKRADLPQDLARLSDQLLQRHPSKRPDANAIAATLSFEIEASNSDSADNSWGSLTSDPGSLLVGRERQLAKLEEVASTLFATFEPQVVFLSGRSGEGKTTLIQHFLQRIRIRNEVLLFSGRCYDRESVPYKAIDNLIDALVSFLRSRAVDELTELIPADIPMLAHLFPVLRRVEAIAHLPSQHVSRLDAKQIRIRAFKALRELLNNLSRQSPIVLVIDDLQWGDADSATVLKELLAPPGPPRVLFLGSYRIDEADMSPFLTEWNRLSTDAVPFPDQHDIQVGPLTENECRLFLVSRLGEDSETIHQLACELYDATGGNPYFVEQLVECFDPETGHIHAVPLSEVIKSRLIALPPSSVDLLEIIAVSNGAISISEAAQAAGMEDSAFSTLTHMRSEKLVRLVGADEQQGVDTYHDKIRETVLDNLGETQRRQLHLAIGETFEKSDNVSFQELSSSLISPNPEEEIVIDVPARIFELAFHFEMGGNSHKALIYSLLAAEQAKTQFALNVALEKYRTAKALSHTGSNHIQYRVLSGMGHALLLSGRYQDAYDTLESAATHANNERDRIKTKARQGEIIYKTRSLNESTQALEQLLFELGYPIPRGQLQTLIEITISSVQLKWLNLRRPNKLSECKPDWKTDLTIRILMQVCYPTLFSDGMKALWASKKALRLASNRSSDAILSSALSIESLVSSRFLPRLQRIQSLSNQAIQLAHDLNDNALTAEAWHLQAASVGALAPSQGRKSSEEAIQRYHQLGDAWRLTYGHAFLAIIQSYLGEFAECIAGSQKAFESAISYGQHRLAQTVLKPWATATGGRLRFDELKSQVIVVTDDLQSTVLLNVAESIWHRHHARTAESLVSAELAFSIMRDYWPFSPLVSVAYPNLVQSLRHHADAVQERDPKQSERIRTRALKLARRGVLVQRIARLDLAYALRELGQCYADIGKIGKAHKVVLRSCRVAVERNANYEHAQSLYVYGRLSEKLRIPEASRQIQEAERLLAGFESQIDEAIRRQQEIT